MSYEATAECWNRIPFTTIFIDAALTERNVPLGECTRTFAGYDETWGVLTVRGPLAYAQPIQDAVESIAGDGPEIPPIIPEAPMTLAEVDAEVDATTDLAELKTVTAHFGRAILRRAAIYESD